MEAEKRLKALGLVLPQTPEAKGNYCTIRRTGQLLTLSGQGPLVDGRLRYTGRIGAELTAEQLTAFETEVHNLKTERAGLVAAAEQRNNLLNSIAEGRSGGAVVRTFPSPSSPAGGEQRGEADPLDSMEYRRAFMAYALRGKAGFNFL